MMRFLACLAGLVITLGVGRAQAADPLIVLSTGAYAPVARTLAVQFTAESGQPVAVQNDTVGGLAKRIRDGAQFDLAILTPEAIPPLVASGFLAPGQTPLARVGVGVVVAAGAPHPDIATVDALRATLLAAPSIAYIDPASGGSSGIYVAKLLAQLGIADAVRAKSVLVPGGLVAEPVARGQATLGIHQISEILAVPTAELVGPLPDAVQSWTVYAAALASRPSQAPAAQHLLAVFTGPASVAVLRAKGMQPPGG